MDIERSIISICATDPSVFYPEALDSGISADIFEGTSKQVWEFVERFIKVHGVGPSADALSMEFPEFSPTFPTEPLSFYLDKLKEKHAYNVTLQSIKGAYADLNSRKVEEAVDKLRQALQEIEDTTTSEADLNWGQTMMNRYEDYKNIQNMGGIDGYTTPFPTLDEATRGFHDGEFILIVARQGVGKTWLTNLLGYTNYSKGLNVLYLTKEMPSTQIARRFDALKFKLPYQDLRKGGLNSMLEASWKKNIESQVGGPGTINIVGEESGGVSHVAAKIEKYKPDIVYIDGMYLMDDDRKAREQYQRIGNISRDLKKLAKRSKTPIIVTVQFNRNADNSKGGPENIAGSDIAKDADVILGLFQDEDQRLSKRVTLRVLKQREGDRPEVELDWDMSSMNFQEAEDDDFTKVSF